VNCAVFTETLLESELFGHEKGAFSGAVERYPGIFERADGGTLFLDEIGDMGLSVQAKILRVLQNQEVRRLGGRETFNVDVRFIAATNKDLDQLTEEGRFRRDLLYRLNAAILSLPPLRKRSLDIPLLARQFAGDYARENGSRPRDISPEVLEAFLAYSWPGNIRELRGAVYYACAVSENLILNIEDLPQPLTTGRGGLNFAEGEQIPAGPLEKAEMACIARTLEEEGHNKLRAAERLSMSRSTLYKKIKQYGLL
jgi:DNA-binding NtrC family response regulator